MAVADPLLETFQGCLKRVDAWRLAHQGAFADSLDLTTLDVEGVVGEFSYSDLTYLSQHGQRALLTIEHAGFRAEIEFGSDGRIRVSEPDGPLEDVFTAEAEEEAARAFRDKNPEAVHRVSSKLECKVHCALVAGALGGFHWVRTEAALTAPEHWLAVCQRLFFDPGPHQLIINDAGARIWRSRTLVARGPSAPDTEAPNDVGREWAAYKHQWLSGLRATLPPPAALEQRSSTGWTELEQYFSCCSEVLSWAWLASSLEVADGRTIMRLDAAASLQVDITSLPVVATGSQATGLCAWAVVTTDSARREALQQAITTQIHTAQDLWTGGNRVLAWAKLTYNLALKGAVAEAVAARRDAVTAARDVASASADLARTGTHNAFDRVFAEVLAVAGLVLANATAIVRADVAHILFAVVAGLAFVTGLSAYYLDYRGAARLLDGLASSLDVYKEWLTDEDRAQITESAVVQNARASIREGQITTGVLLLLVAGSLMIAFTYVK